MSLSGWIGLTKAQGIRRRLAIACRHVIRHPLLILVLAGLAFLITKFGKNFPVLYGMTPLGAVLISWSMGRYRSVNPAEETGDGSQAQDAETT
ncbi:hypothetical protein ABZ438_35265 [Streptomyces sp. NPDC005786]|uniref:hypothetical protein n=1 Tax=Streptomyces sp. NPDC005786 TaxID=3154891 RepID=UPI0033F0F253